MPHQANLIPSWRAYADAVVARLTAEYATQQAARDKARGIAAAPADPDPVDELPALRQTEVQGELGDSQPSMSSEAEGKPHLPSDTGNAPCDTDADEALVADDNRPATRLPAHRLSMAIRLAATIGSEADMRRYTAPEAITLITGIAPAQLGLALGLIRQQLFAPGVPLTTEPKHYGPDDTPILLAPEARGDEITATGQQAFHRGIDKALERDGGLILLAPDAGCLPPGMQQGIPNVIRLTALNREVLITHLRHSHSATGRIDEDAVRDALPDDRVLATLPFTALRLALRAATAGKVAERIAALCDSSQQDGPDLDAMSGSSPALNAARRMIADLRLWLQGKVKWTDLSHSMLLYGPPGTGKTWLARAMGNSAGIACVEGSFAVWQSAGHLGDMLREMRKSFAEARRLAPSILFIDEIDAVGSREDGDTHGSRYQMQVINGFLGEMNSIAREEGVLVIGACNHIDRIDPAVLRAGRFDIKLAVPLPDRATIHGILRRHLRDEIADDDLQALATICVGQSAGAVDAAIRAARSDARHDRTSLSVKAIRRHLGIDADPAQAATDWRVALHECGHAIACAALGCGTVQRLLILPDGGQTIRQSGPQQAVLEDLEGEIAYNLAGRAAERLVLGDVSGGAGGTSDSDLAQATRLALAIDVILGLGADGPVWTAAADYELLRDPVIHARVRQRLEAAEQRATDILAAQESLLRDMAKALLRQRELAGPELHSWLTRIATVEHPRYGPASERPVDHPAPGNSHRHAQSGDDAHQPTDSSPSEPTASD
ncbi:AAA family ATPase [Paracoccus siganidrum]|uniref:AAA family ATPase n=1 Tax=Paracoccus siganidrum TaxID=1276757 RepID=A0A419A765_9RHOB|nr:AAA family ATPase [Paracoccus siganidrum]RJL15837.1 AAA family ATPase [Paracoccus siganidrum]RMC29350.1 AAA family ATPase [Paracoccus siganidrum]